MRAKPTAAAAAPAPASRQRGSPSISTFSIAAFIAPNAIKWKFGAAMERHHLVGEHPGATGILQATTALRLFVPTCISLSLLKVRPFARDVLAAQVILVLDGGGELDESSPPIGRTPAFSASPRHAGPLPCLAGPRPACGSSLLDDLHREIAVLGAPVAQAFHEAGD